MARTKAGTVAIVGRPNVGKSTLLNAFLGEPIAITSRHPQTTRDRILGVLTTPSAQFVFLDTPGLHQPRNRLGARMNQQAKEAAEGADVIAFVTDAASAPPHAGDLALLRDLPEKRPVVLVINKIDRVADKHALVGVLTAYAAAHEFVALVPISARKADGVKRVLAEVEKELPEAPAPYDEDMLTDRPARFLVAEFVREQILKKTREEVPHGVAVVVDRFDEPAAPRALQIELSIHVDREGHKKILVGKGGQMLKEIGTQARARVESLLGRKVMLKLWVRVTPEWYESEAKMRDMGYA